MVIFTGIFVNSFGRPRMEKNSSGGEARSGNGEKTWIFEIGIYLDAFTLQRICRESPPWIYSVGSTCRGNMTFANK
jgi:hypothetical protein